LNGLAAGLWPGLGPHLLAPNCWVATWETSGRRSRNAVSATDTSDGR
jgi:hypothetical protein